MTKMVKCKACGQEIAKTAKACPHCGAKQQNKGVAVACAVIIIITIFAVVGVIASSGGEPNGTQQNDVGNGGSVSQRDDNSAKEVIKVSAEDLYGAYVENAVNADNLYKNKTLEITGIVTNIGQDAITKKPCISLSSGDEFNIYPVQCFFSASSDELAALRDGDEITITGKCTGYSIAFVQLTGCNLN